jgi:translation initiation factor eIF-2B subunit beta
MAEAAAPEPEEVKLAPGLRREFDQFYTQLKRRQTTSAYGNAKQTIDLLRKIVGSKAWKVTSELLLLVRAYGCHLIAADPLQFNVGNVVRRVLFIIREEFAAACKFERPGELDESKQDSSQSRVSLSNLLVEGEVEKMDYTQQYDVRGPIIEAIKELLDELDVLYKNVSEQAINHIHADETIMTFGKSELTKQFLLEAAKKRTIEVFVAEAAPMCDGQQMAKELAEAGIKTTLINDAAIFALMSRMHKVIIGTHAVMANGGLTCATGGHALALAAKQHSVPLVVLAGLHQLCPQYPFDQDTFNELASPMSILDVCGDQLSLAAGDVEVVNPIFDYVPPDLIDLHLTNFGAHNPSYIYRLLAEYYHPDDYVLRPEERVA